MAEPAAQFPRQQARTRRFTLGAPRTFTVTADGQRVLFLRSLAGDDPLTCLWAWENPGEDGHGGERLLVDPRALGAADDDLPAAERARRERVRETAGGIVSYGADRDGERVALTVGGSLYLHELASGSTRLLVDGPGVVEARLDPTGARAAFVRNGALCLVEVADGQVRTLCAPDGAEQTWGLADFIAAEEMGRSRGYWWAPDGTALLAAHVDETPVARWWIAEPAAPEQPPRPVRYPVAGTANAVVSLAVVDLDGGIRPVRWDADRYPYLVGVRWENDGPPLVSVQSRDQRTIVTGVVDAQTGEWAERARREEQPWAEIVPGVPCWQGDALLTVRADPGTDTMRLYRDDQPVSPPGLQVREVLHADGAQVLFTASTEPTEVHVWRLDAAGCAPLSAEPGVYHAVAGGDTVVLGAATLHQEGRRHAIRRGGEEVAELQSLAEQPVLSPHVTLYTVTGRRLAAAVVLPRDGGAGPLPVLMAPYGGPHAQQVLAARSAYLEAQWWADAGFAVVVVDGRGTPGRGPGWAGAVAGDLAGPVLADQVAALQALAAEVPRLDLSRVAIRGWSFGGYLAALAVLRRPDVFHAAVAGAPVTDWRLYDTHYTERYLGQPDADPAAYERCSLLAEAARLTRPLLLVHGLADDNVVAAHTLQLSRALLRAGRPHAVLPLSGVTHMTPQPEVAENLLRLQLEFLRRALR